MALKHETEFTPQSSKLGSPNSCNICFQHYNFTDQTPLIICPQSHTLCKACLIQIRITKRCPFCRADLNFREIYINGLVIQNLKDKIKKSQGNQISAAEYIQTQPNEQSQRNQRFAEFDHWESQQSNVLERNNELNEMLQNMNWQRSESLSIQKCCGILVYLYTIVMQLPFGVISLAISLQYKECYCMDEQQNRSSLRTNFIETGYCEVILSALMVYFAMVKFCNIIDTRGLLCFQCIMIAVALFKCCWCWYIFINSYNNPIIFKCDAFIDHYLLVSIFINFSMMILGVIILFHHAGKLLTR